MTGAAKRDAEIAAEITIAMLGRLSLERRLGGDGNSEITPEYLAPKVAAAYKLIYQAVAHPNQ